MANNEQVWPPFQPATLDMFAEYQQQRLNAQWPFDARYKLAVTTTGLSQINEICNQDNLTADQKLEAVTKLAAQTLRLISALP